MEISTLLRKNILSMLPYSSARDEFKASDRKMIFLDANENPFENPVNRYPDPQQKTLKKALSQLKNISETQILFGNGSDEALDLIFRAFCEPNIDNVITLPPTYGMYGVLANLNAIENREILLSEEFQLQIEPIFEAVNEQTKIIFLCSPNNPTGNSFSKESILTILNNFNGIVVLDEAYIDFSEQEGWLKEINHFPNLIITQTFSKAYGMAGIRLGVLFASEEIISVLNKIKPPYNVNVLTQDKALERLSEIETINSEISSIKKGREELLKQLLQVGFIQKIYPTDANFILVKVDDANKRYQQILNKGIVFRNRNSQPLCRNCLRITIGTSQENKQLLLTLKSIQND